MTQELHYGLRDSHPDAPPSGYAAVYVLESDNEVYRKLPDGSRKKISGGGGALSDAGSDNADGGDQYNLPQAEDSIDLQSSGDIENADVVGASTVDNGGSAIAVGDDLDLQSSQSVTNASSISTDERTITNVAGRGEKNSTQSISNSADTQIELDAVDFEDSSSVLDVDTTNDRIRVKKAGVISMSASGHYADSLGDGTRYQISLKINGSVIAQIDDQTGGDVAAAFPISDIKDLGVDDDITITTFQNSGSSKNLSADERNSLAAVHEG